MSLLQFYFNYVGSAIKWSYFDRGTGEVLIESVDVGNDSAECKDICYRTCDIVPKEGEDVDWLQKYIYKARYEEKWIRLNVKFKKDWKIENDGSIRYTKSQKEWKKDHGFDFIERISKIVKRIKMWVRDLYSINLAIRYKTDKCKVCGMVVGSRHFINECSNLKKIRGLFLDKKCLIDRAIVQYTNWISHCKMKEVGDVVIANSFAVARTERILKKWRLVRSL